MCAEYLLQYLYSHLYGLRQAEPYRYNLVEQMWAKALILATIASK